MEEEKTKTNKQTCQNLVAKDVSEVHSYISQITYIWYSFMSTANSALKTCSGSNNSAKLCS